MLIRPFPALVLVLFIVGCGPDNTTLPETQTTTNRTEAATDSLRGSVTPTAVEPNVDATPDPPESVSIVEPSKPSQNTSEGPLETGDIHGVIYGTDGEPAVMANVVYVEGKLGAASDYNGEYVLKGLPVGHRSLVVTHASGERATLEVDVARGESQVIDITLKQQ